MSARWVKSTIASYLRSLYTALRIIKSDKAALTGFLIIVGYILVAFIGPFFIELDLSPTPERLCPPSWKHPLGTDPFGRDILAQLVHGAREMLIVGFLAGAITVAIGAAIGMLSGYVGGKLDMVLMSITDIVLTIPGFPLLMVIAAFLIGSGVKELAPPIAAVLLSITAWAGLARAIRSQVLAIKEEPFIEAAKTLGLSKFHIIFGEILPNLMPYIAMNFMLSSVGAIYAYVGIMALGLVAYKPGNWGVMLHMAMSYVGTVTGVGSWCVLAPAMAIVLLQIGLVLFSNGVDKLFNPRLREE